MLADHLFLSVWISPALHFTRCTRIRSDQVYLSWEGAAIEGLIASASVEWVFCALLDWVARNTMVRGDTNHGV
ncbi:hypothetical protein QF042_002446 [Pedobacter sp. W3I1]|nr:hypothetical protein [Pedobacter sp. W3I1]